MTSEEKRKAFEVQLPYMGLLGHRFIGFEGKKCARLETDEQKRAVEECAWVYDKRKKQWIKTAA